MDGIRPSTRLSALPSTRPDALLSAEPARIREVVAAVEPATTEAEAIDRIRMAEELKATCAAVQAREADALDRLRAEREEAAGVSAERRCRCVGSEIALARRDSAHRGGRHLGLAKALCREMPHTLSALADGGIAEEHATIMVRETAWLPEEHRRTVDELMAGRLGRVGVRRLAAEARSHAQRLDQESAVVHLERSRRERRVSVRPATGGMAHLTALLPMPQAVAAYATLHRDTSTAVGVGDPDGRTRDQLMADLLVERLTGQVAAAAIPAEIHLVISPDTLLAGGEAPAWLPGHGPIPAAQARELVADPEAEVFLRRLFTAPESGHLVSMDSRSRVFPPLLRRMITLRDDVCRTPWCEAPIRHADHADPYRDGGITSFENGSGLCAQCNLVKENTGWSHRATGEGLTVVTPTGHRYEHATEPVAHLLEPPRSPEPPSPVPRPRGRAPSRPRSGLDEVERRTAAVLSGWHLARQVARLSMAASRVGPADRIRPADQIWPTDRVRPPQRSSQAATSRA